uniref:Methyltransferase domain-containing protein n=1 Tax=Thermofilum pendens TaxID=2269 RepID=A0A7C4FBM8_THEPE
MAARLLGGFGVRLEFEAAVEVSGLDKLPEGAVVLDVFPRVGTSTTTLLEQTRVIILVAEPYPENLEVLESIVRLQRVEDRVKLMLVAPLESLKLQERVDAVFMEEVLHWTPSPQLVLKAVRNQLKQGGFLALAQTVYSSLGMKMGLIGYLLGALRPPPTSSELRSVLRVSGYRVEKWFESMGVVLARASPVTAFV